ncbi:MAG: endonuclease III [Gemmatimonadaceae bacterium]|nr:endonuclease III [Gemmatimonadaceae bacterium]
MKKSPSKPRSAAKRSTKARRARTGAALVAHAREIERRLATLYPDAHCELDFRSPFELLCATILSAQCTDKRVNMVTPALFRRWPDAQALAAAPPEEVEEVIKSTGFFRSKAKSLIGMAQGLVASHRGQVPAEMDALTSLPGVGRKTANVLLGNAFDRNEGIVVDTHVARLAARFGLTRETDAVRIEQALLKLFDRNGWARLSHLFIWHGRRVCDARKPRCHDCALSDICPSAA